MLVNEEESLLTVIKKIDDSKFYFQLVVKNNKLVGTVSDGDIRRAILFGVNLNEEISKCMNTNPIVGNESAPINFKNLMDTIPSMRKFLPVIDKKRNLKYLIVDEEIFYNKSALIMAGGFGKRLGEKTKKVWFYDVDEDGFKKTSSIKGRRKIEEDDLILLRQIWKEKKQPTSLLV